jgi:hypothetical protein
MGAICSKGKGSLPQLKIDLFEEEEDKIYD